MVLRSTFSLAVVTFLCRIVPAWAGGDGDSERWWCSEHDGVEACDEHEYGYVESCILVVLVALALLFEFGHHALLHRLVHTYAYGKLQDLGSDFHSHRYFTPLFHRWFARLSGELTVLGFIAFIVFIFREFGGFDTLARSFPAGESSLHLPPTAVEWLHMVELVHMKLFLGMIIYFSLVYWVVAGSVKHMKDWEELDILRVSAVKTRDTPNARTNMSKYNRWRSYFLADTLSWGERRPWIYRQTLSRLKADDLDISSPHQFMDLLDNHFAFSAYLAYSVCEAAIDIIEFNRITWCCVLAIYAVFAFLQVYAQLITLHYMQVFIVAAFVLLIGLHLVVRNARVRVESTGSRRMERQGSPEVTIRTIPSASETGPPSSTSGGGEDTDRQPAEAGESAGRPHPPELLDLGSGILPAGDVSSSAATSSGEPERFHERFNSELLMLRALQVILFVLSFGFARTVGDPMGWRFHMLELLLTCLGFVVLFLVMALVLPNLIPYFAAVMALPPYFDKENAEIFFQVLSDYSEGGICTAGSTPSAKLNRARTRDITLGLRKKDDDSPLGTLRSRLDAAIDAINEQRKLETAIELLAEQHQAMAARMGKMEAACSPGYSRGTSPAGRPRSAADSAEDVTQAQAIHTLSRTQETPPRGGAKRRAGPTWLTACCQQPAFDEHNVPV